MVKIAHIKYTNTFSILYVDTSQASQYNHIIVVMNVLWAARVLKKTKHVRACVCECVWQNEGRLLNGKDPNESATRFMLRAWMSFMLRAWMRRKRNGKRWVSEQNREQQHHNILSTKIFGAHAYMLHVCRCVLVPIFCVWLDVYSVCRKSTFSKLNSGRTVSGQNSSSLLFEWNKLLNI